MLKSDVRNAVYEAIAAPLQRAGFKGSRREMSFRRVVPGGAHSVVMLLGDYRPTYKFSLSVKARVDAIAALTLPFSRIAPEYWEQASSVMVGPGFFGAHEHTIEDEAGLLAAADALGALFESRMLPWLDGSTDLASIEQQLNTPDENLGQHTGLEHCAFSGLAAASLCGREDLDALAAHYIAEMKASRYEETLERFERFVRHLGLRLPD